MVRLKREVMPVADNLEVFVIESGNAAVHGVDKNSWVTLLRENVAPGGIEFELCYFNSFVASKGTVEVGKCSAVP